MGVESRPSVAVPKLFLKCDSCTAKQKAINFILTSEPTFEHQAAKITGITITCEADKEGVQMLRTFLLNIQFVPDGPFLEISGGDFLREPVVVDCSHFAG